MKERRTATALRRLVIVPAAIVLSSCASAPIYIQPATGDTAKLRIVSNADLRNIWVSHYPGKPVAYKCASSPPDVIAILNNISIRSEFADKGKNSNAVEIAIPADGSEFRFGVPVSYAKSAAFFGLLGRVQTERCIAHVGFVPRPGATYVAVHHMDSKSCGLAISQTANGAIAEIEPTVRTYEQCWDETVLPNAVASFKR